MFDRWGLWRGRTWAFHLFKKHHTQVNDLYWSAVPLLSFAEREQRKAPDSGPGEILNAKVSGRHVFADGEAWIGAVKDFRNWTHLNVVMALCSYLEVYMKKAVTLALESDPGVQHGSARVVDGAVFLKKDSSYTRVDDAQGCLKGAWDSRISAYRKLFGEVPDDISDNISDLDTMRRLRNGVGHTFGRELSAYDPHDVVTIMPMTRVSQERLQKWMGTVERVATAIDEHLGRRHIGEYESIVRLLALQENGPTPHHGWARQFRRQVGTEVGASPGREFSRGLVEYVRRL